MLGTGIACADGLAALGITTAPRPPILTKQPMAKIASELPPSGTVEPSITVISSRATTSRVPSSK